MRQRARRQCQSARIAPAVLFLTRVVTHRPCASSARRARSVTRQARHALNVSRASTRVALVTQHARHAKQARCQTRMGPMVMTLVLNVTRASSVRVLARQYARHAKLASSLSRMGPMEKPRVNIVSLARTAPILARRHVRTATRKSPHARRHPEGPQARANASATLATTRTPTTQVLWR